RVSLSLKATQEDPWQQFARTHAIAQVVPGRVTKLVPFGAFVRVEDGIEGLVHISELAERHVEIPEQVVNVGDELSVKVIDIDLERRRISLSLKQANEDGVTSDEHFDPTAYGMSANYDEQGNYIYPEGFDPDTGDWLPGHEAAKEQWERQYAEAQKRFHSHQEQIKRMQAADVDAEAPTSYTSTTGAEGEADGEPAEATSGEGSDEAARPAPAPGGAGTLASDEALQALREKLAGGGE
ncbi:MAG TPA: S1 RNA-binding domain-containing protein, partial [Mycobacteriales bacterium]|nr:S1 RNA-binding domain-containing protein [Mycobacteriales bacterium]